MKYKLVPVKPTEEQLESADLFFTNASFVSVSPAQIEAIYQAMFDAAPSPPQDPYAWLAVNDQGFIVGAWKDKQIAEAVCAKGQPSHHQKVIPVFAAPPA